MEWRITNENVDEVQSVGWTSSYAGIARNAIGCRRWLGLRSRLPGWGGQVLVPLRWYLRYRPDMLVRPMSI